MRHPNDEAIARLLDDPPSAEEAEHLANCASCRRTLEELAAQRAALRGLAAPGPEPEDWRALEARMEREGLLTDPASSDSTATVPTSAGATASRFAERPLRARMRVAAAIVLFLGGGSLGAFVAGTREAPANSILLMDDGTLALVTAADDRSGWASFTVEEAERLVRMTEVWHATALQLYGERTASAGAGGVPASDPVGRYVTLQTLVMATEAAVRGNPADPFLNGLHASAVAERAAQLERLAYTREEP